VHLLVDVLTAHSISQYLRYSISVTHPTIYIHPILTYPDQLKTYFITTSKDATARRGMYNVYRTLLCVVSRLPSGQYPNMWL
jgi:hypothetical protein